MQTSSLCPHLMLFGKNLQRKENPWRENARDARPRRSGWHRRPGHGAKVRAPRGPREPPAGPARPTPLTDRQPRQPQPRQTPLPGGLQTHPGLPGPAPNRGTAENGLANGAQVCNERSHSPRNPTGRTRGASPHEKETANTATCCWLRPSARGTARDGVWLKASQGVPQEFRAPSTQV